MPRHYCCYCCCCCCLVVIAETGHMYEKLLLKLLLQRSAGSMASQRSDAVECVHCFAGSMASQRDGVYTSQWTIKFMHCKTCAQIVCEFCMRNHSDCTPWYKTRSSLWRDADTQPLARCRFLAGVDRHPAAGGVGMLHCYHCNEEMLWISTFIKCDRCAEIVCRFCVRDHTPDTGCWRGACEVNSLPTIYRVARFQTPVPSD